MSSSLRKWLVLGSAIGVSALLFSGCGGSGSSSGPGPQPGGDDDRPPIVVSDGSVHLRNIPHTRHSLGNSDPGAWVVDGGKWVNEHKKDKKGTHLLVSVLYSTTSGNCGDPNHVWDVSELALTYGPTSGPDKTFTMKIDTVVGDNIGLRTSLASADAAVDLKVPFWLDVGGASDRVKSVTLPATGGTTCDLDTTKGEVHIYQSIK